ncbi:hypothetical protein BJV78DRAFT_1132017 [Lactifluus subvellereus]|nr:hypothetical protein BJV78DRAFT_1132017 [Lactifluus subvellereus]
MIRAAGNNKNNNNNDPQTSLTLDPKVIADGFKNNGQQGNATPGQVASLTSSNNFINFCLTVPNKPITNGQQVLTGSCNPAPMGVIAAKTNMPSSKFVNPTNFDTIKANTAFDIKMAITHLQAGNFVNAESNYYSAPQQVNNAGDIIGHSHFVVQKVDSFKSTKVLDPTVFAFFKGVNTAADQAGNLAVTVDGGLPEGLYRLASINTSANHTPALVAVAQHGSLDDQVYVSVLPYNFVDFTKVSPPSSSRSLLTESLLPVLPPTLRTITHLLRRFRIRIRIRRVRIRRVRTGRLRIRRLGVRRVRTKVGEDRLCPPLE